jgi:hypothetical protein
MEEFVVNWFTHGALGSHLSEWLASALVILLTFALCHLTWRVMEMQPSPRLFQREEKILLPLRAEACDSRWFVFVW